MVKPIVHDEKFLCVPAEPATAEDLSIAYDLLDTLNANLGQCVGMAANMIGSAKQIIVFADNKKLRLMLNPVLIHSSGEYTTEEGCLSLTGTRKALRYRSIRLSYQDENMLMHTGTFLGFTAQIIQHEMDHLKGIII